MTTAKLFKHGGSQAVRLPKEFRMPGDCVYVEMRGETVILRPVNGMKMTTFADLARQMKSIGGSSEFPDRDLPAEQERNLDL